MHLHIDARQLFSFIRFGYEPHGPENREPSQDRNAIPSISLLDSRSRLPLLSSSAIPAHADLSEPPAASWAGMLFISSIQSVSSMINSIALDRPFHHHTKYHLRTKNISELPEISLLVERWPDPGGAMFQELFLLNDMDRQLDTSLRCKERTKECHFLSEFHFIWRMIWICAPYLCSTWIYSG